MDEAIKTLRDRALIAALDTVLDELDQIDEMPGRSATVGRIPNFRLGVLELWLLTLPPEHQPSQKLMPAAGTSARPRACRRFKFSLSPSARFIWLSTAKKRNIRCVAIKGDALRLRCRPTEMEMAA